MIVDDNAITYILSLELPEIPLLEEIEAQALADDVPVIRKETKSLLKVLVTAVRPGKILEIGTAVGYSALVMSAYAPESCKITTIENYEKRIPIARENIRKAGKEDMIHLLFGDAMDILPTLAEAYDFIFLDAAKGQYIHYLPQLERLLRPGGMLVSDNVLQDGDVLKSRFAVERRNRTIHSRMREYLMELKHSPVFETAILPVGDGVAVSVKRSEG